MVLKVYNSRSRSKETFEPLNPPVVNMYVCGITAYDFCHLGHARVAVVFDAIYRYLQWRDYQVRYVRNFTDIDDKIIKRANETGKDWRDVCETFIAAFHEDMNALGNLKPTMEPRATEFISAMQQIISTLIEKEIAYAAGGDVFYSVKKFSAYGQLSHKKIEELEAGARIEVQEAKHNPLDFALWKGAKPGEPWWPSPWGEGRPGWHIECSAMSTVLLGPSFDIHGGGRDLIFPHHENELAQSEGAYEKPFAKYWIHNGFVNLNADKMSKSTGNFLTIRDVLKHYPFEVVRYFLLSSHYRSPLDFSDQNMKDAMAGVDRVFQTLERFESLRISGEKPNQSQGKTEPMGALNGFLERANQAMEDDFNTASVFAALFDVVREVNKFLDQAHSASEVEQVKAKFSACMAWVGQVLGIFGRSSHDYFERRRKIVLESLGISEESIQQKIEARKEGRRRKNFQLADQIRNELAAMGILLKDNPDGSTIWSVK